MKNAKAKEKKIIIPTYGTGKPQHAPMFFEKRVYQGSSGKVYPNAVTEKICDEKKDAVYDAVVLENDYVEVVVLPSLGGRVYYAIDKTNGYDFVYRNKVIKPALVGLLGPWISGGIEFNWPQHHRPTTFMPVNYKVENFPDGSACVYVGETERMFGLRHVTCIKLYKDRSYIEISTTVYNGENSEKTFLWWANPAYKVNDDTVTVMPPDVNAVMDHGKRAVSTFPVATGEYYKMDYSKGVDISRYKNIPVPTSFMAYKSHFDFIGGYDYGKKAGLLHVADHLISPGKKQWTWGCGDFGKAWDKNLTDEDGPYVELMTGCFTDNQPDFTFIEPHESKKFTQYFMPYHEVGRVLNADENVCFGCENGYLTIHSSIFAEIKAEFYSDKGEKRSVVLSFAPCESKVPGRVNADLPIILNYGNRRLVFDAAKVKKFDVPSPATACPEPCDCKTTEESYLFGRHIEQYRHATRIAQDYYEEGLRRDSTDIRLNNALGECLYERGLIKESINYFETAVKKATVKNGNPQDADCFYNLAKAQFALERYDDAYENFGRCLWGNKRAQGLYFLALTEKIRGRCKNALDYIRQCVCINGEDTLARNFYALLLRDTDEKKSRRIYGEVLEDDPLNVIAAFCTGDFRALKRVSADEIRTSAGYFFQSCDYEQAYGLLKKWTDVSGKKNLLADWYRAYAKLKCGKRVSDDLDVILNTDYDDVNFAVSLTDKKVISELLKVREDYLLYYHLGNLEYDKRNYDKAAELWKKAAALNPGFAVVKRNLALYEFNKKRNGEKALEYMQQAFECDKNNSRFLFELSQLYSICGKSNDERLTLLKNNVKVAGERDDLYAEYLGLVADSGQCDVALSLLSKRKFHPWEGGEGKVTGLYKLLKCAMAERFAANGDYAKAEESLKDCFVFPDNLGEGKLVLDYDNDVWYRLGNLYDIQGKKAESQKAYAMAKRGNLRIEENMYYNDMPADYLYYAALASLRLGDKNAALGIAKAFSDYAANNKGKERKIDYFAVSLPDLLVWEKDRRVAADKFCDELTEYSESIVREVNALK